MRRLGLRLRMFPEVCRGQHKRVWALDNWIGVYVFLRRECDRVICSLCGWVVERLVNLLAFQRPVAVCFRGGFAGGWVDVRVHVLRDFSMCVCLCADVTRKAFPVPDIGL